MTIKWTPSCNEEISHQSTEMWKIFRIPKFAISAAGCCGLPLHGFGDHEVWLVCVLVMINYLWINHWQLSLFLYLILFIILDLFGPTNKERAGPNDAELLVGRSSQLPGSSVPLSIAIMWNGVQMIAPNTCQTRVQIRFISQNMPMMGFETLVDFNLSPHSGWVYLSHLIGT